MNWRELRNLKLGSDSTWARVEGSPRADKPDDALAAEIRDPYWFLARQWALGELQGDDAASPMSLRLTTKSRPIGRPQSSGPSPALLEADIEGEPYTADLRIRIQAGLELKRLLGDDAVYARFIAAEEFQLPDLSEPDAFPEPDGSLVADEASRAFLAAVNGRVPDGFEILIRHRLGTLPGEFDTPQTREPLDRLVSWFEDTYTVFPDESESKWVPSTLEYNTTVELGGAGDAQALEVDDYHGGRLDWWNFDLTGAITWDQQEPEIDVTSPTTIEFPGMPRSRYWEMEDWRMDFGQITAARTDLTRLILAEFALVYGEDWFSAPIAARRGSLIRLERLEVTNTFRERFIIPPAGRPSDISWDNWSTGHPSVRQGQEVADAQRLILFAPTTLSSTDGPPIEEVVLARDEMANIMWGIEGFVANHLGEGTSVMDYWGDRLIESPQVPTQPALYYTLMTDVPRNWIPFARILDLSVSPARATALERLPFLRTSEDETILPVLPLGAILGREDPPGSGRYRLAEEGVNRVAQRLVRRFERARGPDGRVHIWTAIHRTPTQPHRQSGLRFDVVTNVGQEERSPLPPT